MINQNQCSGSSRICILRLSHRFPQADSKNGYHFRLSTLIEEGALPQDLITTNIVKIKDALAECSYIIDRYIAKEEQWVNPKTNRSALIDLVVTVYPTKVFQDEQYRLNAHAENIRNYKVDTE